MKNEINNNTKQPKEKREKKPKKEEIQIIIKQSDKIVDKIIVYFPLT